MRREDLHVGYMHKASVKSHYDQLASTSKAENADSLWTVILPRYFRPQDGFSIHVEPPFCPAAAASEAKQGKSKAKPGKSKPKPRKSKPTPKERKAEPAKTDFSIRVIKLSQQIRLVLLEDKRTNGECQPSIWRQGREHATEYLLAKRKKQDKDLPLFALVNVGRDLHFYELEPQSDALVDLPWTDGLEFDIRDNEENIDEFLCIIVKRLMGLHGCRLGHLEGPKEASASTPSSSRESQCLALDCAGCCNVATGV